MKQQMLQEIDDLNQCCCNCSHREECKLKLIYHDDWLCGLYDFDPSSYIQLSLFN